MKVKKLILVVEDEEMVRDLLIKELHDNGYATLEAEDGEIAMKLWETKRPDLVLLDILLPKMDGFQLMKTIREHPNKNLNDAPVLVLSNLFEKNNIEKMSKYDVEDYLVKANNTTADVIARIDRVFAN